ncbi:hypothetical protein [Gallaecimonas mangrovi]|uniref:hypothetical protein n=1 Tax=Gallaecimonas mangrovi TaxID=2291597 RepID=UPI000E1FC3BB|nr:hypothetical protein [Gallaecimonas mangrovi]
MDNFPAKALMLERLKNGDLHQRRKVAKQAEAWATATGNVMLAGKAKGFRKRTNASRDQQVRRHWQKLLHLAELPLTPEPNVSVSGLYKALEGAAVPTVDALLSCYCQHRQWAKRHYKKAFACRHPKPRALHQLRKHLKIMEALATWLNASDTQNLLKKLGDLLGDDHDLSLIKHPLAKTRRRAGHNTLYKALKGFFKAT